MGKAHSGDLRARVYGEIAGGGSRRAAARRPGTSASTGVRLAQRMAVTGPLARARQRRPAGGGKLAAHGASRSVGSRQGDITMPESAARLVSELGRWRLRHRGRGSGERSAIPSQKR